MNNKHKQQFEFMVRQQLLGNIFNKYSAYMIDKHGLPKSNEEGQKLHVAVLNCINDEMIDMGYDALTDQELAALYMMFKTVVNYQEAKQLR